MTNNDLRKIGFDYIWNIPKRLIYRKGISKEKHLLHSYGNLPAFNKRIVEEYADRVYWWGASTNEFRYLIRTQDLLNGQTVSFEEPQLIQTDREKWLITPLRPNLKLF